MIPENGLDSFKPSQGEGESKGKIIFQATHSINSCFGRGKANGKTCFLQYFSPDKKSEASKNIPWIHDSLLLVESIQNKSLFFSYKYSRFYLKERRRENDNRIFDLEFVQKNLGLFNSKKKNPRILSHFPLSLRQRKQM